MTQGYGNAPQQGQQGQAQGYNWEDNAKLRAGRMPEGQQYMTVRDVYFKDKQGAPYTSQAGDPQLLLIFVNDRGEEGSEFVTLSGTAAWKLSAILAASGADLRRLQQDGVQPHHFADERFGLANLQGRRFYGDCVHEKGQGQQSDRVFTRITPLRPPQRAAQPQDSNGQGSNTLTPQQLREGGGQPQQQPQQPQQPMQQQQRQRPPLQTGREAARPQPPQGGYGGQQRAPVSERVVFTEADIPF